MNLPKQHGTDEPSAHLLCRLPLKMRQESAELSHEFTLPDYLPEIHKLLRVTLRVLPPECYAAGGSAELSGKLLYDVLYVGPDGDLYSSVLPEEYAFSVPFELPEGYDTSSGIDAFASPVPELLVTRVLSPRKLGIRTRMKSHARAFLLHALGEEACGGNLERLTGTADTAVILRGVSAPIELGDEILDGRREGDPLRVISSEGHALVTEAIPEEGSVSLRGEFYLKLLTSRGKDNPPSVLLRKLPFSARVEIPGTDRLCDARAVAIPSRLDLSVEDGRILVDAELIATAECQRNDRIPYTRDLYSTERETETETVTELLPFALLAGNGNFTLSDTVPLDAAGLTGSHRILDVTGDLTPESVTEDHGKTLIVGTGRFHILTENSENGEYGTSEITRPFRYLGEGHGTSDRLPPIEDYDVSLIPVSIRLKSDGEKLALDAEIAVSYRTAGRSAVTRVSHVRFGDPIRQERGRTVLAYPAKGERLWETARRYHAPLLPLADRNGIDPEPDAEVSLRFLVISE